MTTPEANRPLTGDDLETGHPNALEPMDAALLIHNLVGLRQLLDIERGSNWQGRCHFLNQTIRTVQHLSTAERQRDEAVRALEGLRDRALEMTKAHGDPNGTDYAQGVNDQGHRWHSSACQALQSIGSGDETRALNEEG